jgi:penicillin-binding protein 2
MAKEYRIPIAEDFVSPEETLLDAGSEFSDLEQPISSGVFRFGFWVILGFLIVILGVSMKMSIFDFKYLSGLAIQNKSGNFSVSAPRGIIFDSQGQPLVKNVPSFDLIAISKELKNILNQKSNPDLKKIADVLKFNEEELIKKLNDQVTMSNIFFVANDLTKDQVLSIQYLKPEGLYIVPDVQRFYMQGPEFSQILGYTGKVSKDDLKDEYYTPTDSIGRLGIEKQYEDYLRGTHGRIFFGDTFDTNDVTPLAGKNIVLNIKSDLQDQLYRQLHDVLASNGLSRGAAIIQNPQNGNVVAMVSFPTFDNNLFSQGLSTDQFKSIFENPAKPLFNRVISGLYNPGSTIKPLMGLMTLQEGVMKPQDTIHDCISITIPNPFNKDVSYTFKNWREDFGDFNLRRAIANSCNIYFFTVGGGFGKIIGLGAERIVKYLTAALANKSLGIDLPGEDHGFVPSPDWKQETRHEPWYQGDTYNISIGQGDLIVTPLWLNSYISAIANGGTLYQPQIVNRIVDDQKNPFQIFQTKALEKLPFRDDVLKEIKSDMEETILSGTAQVLKDLPVRAGAKTGTAEVIKGQSINSLFTAFAPVDHPEISITVLVEGSASNQGLAIRVAHNVLKWYFNLKPASASLGL